MNTVTSSSTAKHTAGPWSIGDFCTVACADGKAPNERNKEEAMANAHLIAAAPELLDALKDAVDFMSTLPVNMFPASTVARYEKLITKAEGN